jgi:hypothetical protein
MVRLPARCDRAAVQTILVDLAAAIGPDPVEIDASEVEQAGQALLQLLVSARYSGGGARIIPSDALRKASSLAGLEQELFGEVQS